MANVAIVGGTEETRLLLRGLARLHHHRVVGEGPLPEALETVAGLTGPLVLLLQADLDEGSGRIAEILRGRPDVRAILITPHWSPRLEAAAKGIGLSAVLRRPFAVHQLVSVLAAPSAAEGGEEPVRAGGPDPPPAKA